MDVTKSGQDEQKAEQRRKEALVGRLIDTAAGGALNDADAASALMRSAAIMIGRRVGEEEACKLMLAALIETSATLARRRGAVTTH